MTLRLAVFDCDGTLVDSQGAIVSSMAESFAAHGLAPVDALAVRRIVGLSLVEAIARLRPDLDDAMHLSLAEGYKAAFNAQRQRGEVDEPLFPGIVETLDALEAEGVLLGVATGKSMRGLRAVLDGHGLRERFVTLQTADVGPGKPHPAMLNRALAEAGAAPEHTVMIGDTTYDIQMARAAKTRSVGVAWGYHAPGELTGAGADRLVDDAAALTAAVLDVLDGTNG